MRWRRKNNEKSRKNACDITARAVIYAHRNSTGLDQEPERTMHAINKITRSQWKKIYGTFRKWEQADRNEAKIQDAYLDSLDAAAEETGENRRAIYDGARAICYYAYWRDPRAEWSSSELLAARLYNFKDRVVPDDVPEFFADIWEPIPPATSALNCWREEHHNIPPAQI